MNAATTPPVLELQELRVAFGHDEVVRGVSLAIAAGECVAIVGESGSGKSVTARSLLGMAGELGLVSKEAGEVPAFQKDVDLFVQDPASEAQVDVIQIWSVHRGVQERQPGRIIHDHLGAIVHFRVDLGVVARGARRCTSADCARPLADCRLS